MDLWATKLLVIFLAWVIICSFALVPMKVSNFFIAQGQPGRKVMGIMNCFGGGIFFGSYLLHMAPEVRMLLEISWLKPKNIVYPFPELFMGLGFFIVLYLEKLFKAANDKNQPPPDLEVGSEIMADDRVAPDEDGNLKKDRRRRRRKRMSSYAKNLRCSCIQGEEEVKEVRDDVDGNGENEAVETTRKIQCLCVMCHRMSVKQNRHEMRKRNNNDNNNSNSHAKEENDDMDTQKDGTEESLEPEHFEGARPKDVVIHVPALQDVPEKDVDGNAAVLELVDEKAVAAKELGPASRSSSLQEVNSRDSSLDSTRSVILILSLSLHCLFEGMGCGLQVTEARVWNLFIVLAAHEWVVAFSIGLQLTKCYSTRGVIIGAILYSLMTPSGIAIGTAISESPGPVGHNALINGLLKAIAAGTFINVTFLEILKDKLSSDSSCAKIFALTLGYVLMALLSLIPIQDPDDDYAINNRTAVVI